MSIIGISCGFHDAAMTVVSEAGEILYAGHSERYSKKKHDPNLCAGLIDDAMRYAGSVSKIAYYEKPFRKWTRQLYARQKPGLFPKSAATIITDQYYNSNRDVPSSAEIVSFNHHLSHAAAGFQTSPFCHAAVVVIDAIGEWDTISIYEADYKDNGEAQYKRLWKQTYPHSIGLLYSAFTNHVNLRPMDEEYILMGMAAWGKPDSKRNDIMNALVVDRDKMLLKNNLHIGLDDATLAIMGNLSDYQAANVAQSIAEELICSIMQKAKDLTGCMNLVYTGGVALNCTANRLLSKYFKEVWIMPNPGDAGSSLGAAALAYKKKLKWTNAYLGYNIKGEYPIYNILNELYTNKIVGVASGRAEFGPRALGNRSLLADPRGPDIKAKVNDIKRRQQFRPFAPVILEEHVNEYFEMPQAFKKSPYMQAVAKCKYPEYFPAIIHIDGTSRVQTVPNDGSGIRLLLEAWYKQTQCPMLLNTSLNIRGEPMVNDINDAIRFESAYGIKVCY